MAVKTEGKLYTPVFRASYPNLLQPRGVNGGKPEYSVVMLFPKTFTDRGEQVLFDQLRAAVSAAAEEKWGPRGGKNWPKVPITSPFRMGDEPGKVGQPGYGANVVFAAAKAKQGYPPGLIHPDGKTPITSPAEFKAGDYARARVTVYAWEYMGKYGVSIGLRNLQKVRDGEPLGGSSAPQDDFDAIIPPAGEAAASSSAPAGAATPPTGAGFGV